MSLAFERDANAYPSFTGYGYTSCLNCHYNPLGNGPLSDYGRGLSTTIAAHPFYTKKSDDEVAMQSGFLGNPEKLPSWLRPSIDFRGMYYVSDVKGKNEGRFIPMQLEGSLAMQTNDGKFTAVGTLGYAPPPAAYPESKQRQTPTLIAREHYLGFRPKEEIGFYLGMMDAAYGIRIPEHIAYSRVNTGLAQNDQTHGLLVHSSFGNWEIAAHGFAGNFFQKPELRQKGGSILIERSLSERSEVGISALYSLNNYRKRTLMGFFGKIGIGEGSCILIENGWIVNSPNTQDSKTGHYIFFQNTLKLARGLHFLGTFEFYTNTAFNTAPRSMRITPGLQYFPFQRLEFRLELQSTRTWEQGEVNDDQYGFMGQVHLWL